MTDTIKLPFIQHLRDRVVGQVARRPTVTSRFWDAKVELEDEPATHDVLVHVEARMFFQQRVSEAALRASRAGTGAELERVRERAVRAIAHEAYGPIEQELRAILILLWEEGMAGSEAANRINAMLPILRGECGDD
jgi:hypothetical protein